MPPTIAITIGIPTYNRLDYLREAIDSSLSQPYPHFELLISQNPHPDPIVRDEIAAYCELVTAQDARVRYQLQPRDLGPPANFQWLVDNAQGDYILLIGDDDHLLPNGLQTLATGVAPGVVVSFGRRHIIDEQGRRQPRCVPPANPDLGFFGGWPFTQYEVPAGDLSDAELWAWRQAMGVETSLVRVADFRRVRYREDIDMPDLEFFIMLARADCGKFVFVPEYVTEYRFHPNSTTGRGFNNFGEVFEDLARLPVRATIERYKRELLEVLAFNAINKCLLTGNLSYARRLLASDFCPPKMRNSLKGRAIKISSTLPHGVGMYAFDVLYAIKHGRRYRTASA